MCERVRLVWSCHRLVIKKILRGKFTSTRVSRSVASKMLCTSEPMSTAKPSAQPGNVRPHGYDQHRGEWMLSVTDVRVPLRNCVRYARDMLYNMRTIRSVVCISPVCCWD